MIKLFKLPSFFKLPKHKEFEFKPRYYDAHKEEFEKRIENTKNEISGKYKLGIRNLYNKKRGKYSESQKKLSNFRIAIIIMILLFLAYILLK